MVKWMNIGFNQLTHLIPQQINDEQLKTKSKNADFAPLRQQINDERLKRADHPTLLTLQTFNHLNI